jgi:DNA-binding MarR family transcriptional regulator
MPAATVTPVEALVRELYSLGAARREIGRHALAELGTQGFLALGIAFQHGPVRISEIARRLAVDLSVASRQVAALAEAGYVTRERDAEDGRAQVIAVTPTGRRVLRDSHRRMVDAFADVLADWSDAELEALTERLARFNKAFIDS